MEKSIDMTEAEKIEQKRRVDVAYYAAKRFIDIRNEIQAIEQNYKERTPSKVTGTFLAIFWLVGFWLVSTFAQESGWFKFGTFILIFISYAFIEHTVRSQHYNTKRDTLFYLLADQKAIFNGAMGGHGKIHRLMRLWQNSVRINDQSMLLDEDSVEFKRWWDQAYADSFMSVCGVSRGRQIAKQRGYPNHDELWEEL